MSAGRDTSTGDPARDRRILARMAQGETAAVTELYDGYSRLVFSLIYKMIQDGGRAEDLTQEVFVRVWRAAATYQPEVGSVRAWLLSIAHHCAIDEIRRRRRERAWLSLDEMDAEIMAATPEAPVEPLMGRALKALPDDQRRVIELAYFHGLTMQEIADRIGVAVGTVKSRARLALIKLRAQLGADSDHN